MNPTFGDNLSRKSKEVDPIFNEIGIFKQLIKERKHSLGLIRELLSNSGAKEVGASKIVISYTKDREGHIFDVSDDGCGMNYTGDVNIPGRLDRFLGLGLSAIIGKKADEFSYKGLGSKLSYHSRRVQIETCAGDNHPFIQVIINEPWETIERNDKPKPRISEHPTESKGTKIRVIGHPPQREEEPFSFDEIKTYLLHRTFAGFTRKRENAPVITLSVLGKVDELEFGFPEFKNIDFEAFSHEGLKLDEEAKTLFINMTSKSSKEKPVRVKGFVTWDTYRYRLSSEKLNTGLILSVKGIPYFNLDMEEYGVTTIRTARPGEKKSCIVVECDWIQGDMDISRSGLNDLGGAFELKRIVREIFQRIESSDEYLKFRTLPEKNKTEAQSGILAEQKRKIEERDQNWVVYIDETRKDKPITLMREPQNEHEVNALIWKLEALNALPFETFQSLAYIGAAKGPDLLVNFLEEKGGEPQRATVVEVELNFYNYKTHGHVPQQYPKVVCWDIPASGRKVKLVKTKKPYKYTATTPEYQLHVFVIKQMPGIRVMSREELGENGILL